MSVRTKTKRRLAILLTGTFLLVGLAAGAYFLRQHQLNNRAKEARAEGMVAARAEVPDYPIALHRIGLYLQRFPNDAEALSYYAQARENVPLPRSQHIFQAIALYRRTVDLNPEDMRARHALLDLYLRGGYMTEAKDTAEAILDRAKDDIPAMRGKAIALVNLNPRAKGSESEKRRESKSPAEEAVADWIRLAPQDVDAYALVMALMLKTDKSPSDILTYAIARNGEHPDDPRFTLLLAKTYFLADKGKEWRESVLTAAKSNLADPAFIEGLVEQLDAVNRYDLRNLKVGESIEDRSFEVLTRPQVSSLPQVQRMLAARLWQAGRAQEIVDRLADLNPNAHTTDTLLLAFRAMALFKLSREPDATTIITALAGRDSDPVAKAWANYLRVAFTDARNDDKRLLQVCEEGLAIQPNNPYFLYSAGEAYSRMGETDLAIQQWGRAFSSAPTWSAPLVQMSRALTSMGRFDQGRDAADRAWQVSPKDPAALAVRVASRSPWLHSMTDDERKRVLEWADEVPRGEEQTVAIKVALLAKSTRRDEAIALIESVLAAKSAPGQAMLLDLAAVSEGFKLGLEEACLNASEKAHGVTAELAMARAMRLYRQKLPEEGLKLLDVAQSGAHEGDALTWQMQRARYLDLIWVDSRAQTAGATTRPADPRARQAMEELGDSQVANLKVQWMVLSARSVATDHDFIGRTIERIHSAVGDKGIAWRVAKAKLLVRQDSLVPDEKMLVEASSLLNDVIRADPDMLEPRKLLAQTLAKLHNNSGAIQQLTETATRWPDEMSIQLQLARLLKQQGEVDRARDCLDKVVAPPASQDEMREAAGLLAEQGDLDRAVDKADKARKAYGDIKDQPPDLLMAALYQQQGKFAEAKGIYTELLKKRNAGIIQAAVVFYLEQGKREEAERILAMLDDITAAPGAKELIRGDFQQRIGDSEKALAYYYAAVKAAPEKPALWRQVIVTHLSLNQIAPALAAANQALVKNPDDRGLAAFIRQADAITAVGANEQFRPMVVGLLTGDRDTIPLAESILAAIVDSQRNREWPGLLADRLRLLADKNENLSFLPLQNLVARLYAGIGRLNEAADIARRTMRVFPNEVEPARMAAIALSGLGRPADAVAAAQEWRKRAPSNPMEADLIIAGFSPPKEALERIKDYIKPAEANPDRYAGVITAYVSAKIALGDVSEAEREFRDLKLLDRSPTWRANWMGLAARRIPPELAGAWMTKLDTAIPASALNERIELANAWFALAERTQNAAQNNAHKKSAKDMLARVTQEAMTATNPNTLWLWRIAGIHEMAGDPATAEVVYRKALQIDPAHPGCNNNLAVIVMQKGGEQNLKEAETLAQRAVQNNGAMVGNYWDTLASIQAQMGKYKEAIASIEAAVKLNPDDLDWLRNKARILDISGDSRAAEPVYRQVLKKNPDDAVSNNNLAVIVMGKGGDLNLMEAKALARRAVDIVDRLPEETRKRFGDFYDTLAAIQAATKDYAAAKESIKTALGFDSKNVNWRVTEAGILADSPGDFEKARAAVLQIDAMQPKASDLSDPSRKKLDSLRQRMGSSAGAR